MRKKKKKSCRQPAAIKKCFSAASAGNKGAIDNLEIALKDFPQVGGEPTHLFCNKMYARTLFMPKDTVWTGKIHNQDHIVIISYGDVTVTESLLIV